MSVTSPYRKSLWKYVVLKRGCWWWWCEKDWEDAFEMFVLESGGCEGFLKNSPTQTEVKSVVVPGFGEVMYR
jgi:hypothetical protein